MQADRRVVLAAVAAGAGALKHAAFDLREEESVVLAAVRSSAVGLKYASDALRARPGLVPAAHWQCSFR